MKKLLVLMFIILANCAESQSNCGIPIPPNLQPDTITTLYLHNATLLLTNLPGAKATSNHGFKTKYFDLWCSVIETDDISGFVERSINSDRFHQHVDTLNCKIFGENYTAIVVKSPKNKSALNLYVFPEQAIVHNVFIVTVYRRKNLNRTIKYLETYF